MKENRNNYEKTVVTLPFHPPVVLKATDKLNEAAHAMKNNNVGSVVVSDSNGELIGIATDRDICFALAILGKSPESSINELMGREFVGVMQNGSLGDVISIMRAHGVRRLPILEMSPNTKKYRCSGVISLDDLVRANLISLEDQSEILNAQLKPFDEERVAQSRMKNVFRSHSRKTQKYKEFIKDVEAKTGLAEERAKEITDHVLSFVLQRLPVNEGRKFLSQLPQTLQLSLYSEVSEPDRSFDIQMLIEKIAHDYGIEKNKAQSVVQGFWQALSKQVTPGEVDHVMSQLPKKMQKVLIGSENLML